MSDEVATITNVEDDAPPAPVTATPPPEAQPPQAVTEDAEPEPDQVDGLLAALRAERAEKKALRERATRADDLERQVNEFRPYVEFLRQNPGLTQPRQEPARPAPDADPEVEQIARDFDLYTPEGKPDLQRAQRIIQRQNLVAQRAAEQIVKPVQQSAAQQQSMAHYQRALTAKLPDGRQVDQETLTTLWRSLPADLTADQNVAVMLTLMATGATTLTGAPKVQPPLNAPLVTEAPGGNTRARQPLTGTSRKIVQARGISEEAYHKLTDGFKPGRTNVLEDD